MTSPFETDDFKKLQKEWDDKLEESGFRDIEYKINGVPADYLVGPNPMDFVRKGKQRIHAAQSYYEAARKWTWHLRETRVQRDTIRVWDLHAQGKSVASIVKLLSCPRKSVTKILRVQKREMLRRVRNLQAPYDLDLTA